MRTRMIITLSTFFMVLAISVNAQQVEKYKIFASKSGDSLQVCDGIIDISKSEIVIEDKTNDEILIFTCLSDRKLYQMRDTTDKGIMKRYELSMNIDGDSILASMLLCSPAKGEVFWNAYIYIDKQLNGSYKTLKYSYFVVPKDSIKK